MNHLFSKRVKDLKASEIREILKLTAMPDMISFAGGLPAPELFPVQEMKEVTQYVLDTMGQAALQYSPTEGYLPLREKIAKRMKKSGIETTAESILITSGSQQGLDFSGKVFLDEGDTVFCESPSYLGAINAFRVYQCQFEEIPTDEDGMLLDKLEEAIQNAERPKLIYVIPDFQNPSGRTWNLERRKKLVELANKYNLPIVEDNPYGELRFEGEALPAVKSFDTEGRVIFLGTFSKTFCPGLRIGWTCASDEILSKYNQVKQGSDLQTNSMSQRELDVFLEKYDFDAHIEKIKAVYKHRRDLMMSCIKEHFPKDAKYTYPVGGLFTWVELPESIDTKALMQEAVKLNVAYVPGASFFPNGGVTNAMRVNFSNMPDEKIKEGISRLGKLLKEQLT